MSYQVNPYNGNLIPVGVKRTVKQRAPLASDYQYPEGMEWVDDPANTVYFLADVTGTVATWKELAAFASPLTTKGDLLVNNGAVDIRQGIGTDTHVLTADSTETSGLKWAAPGSSVSYHVGYRSGQYYTKFSLDALTANLGSSHTKIKGHEIFIGSKHTFATIGIYQTLAAGAGTKCKLAIYTMGTDASASAIVVQTGEISIDATGFLSATINQELDVGMYWLACISSATNNIYGWSADDALYVGQSVSAANPIRSGFENNQVYGDGFPASFNPEGTNYHPYIALTLA